MKPADMPELSGLNNDWVQVRLEINDSQARLKINDFETKVDHSALLRDKSMVMITFAHGELTVRDFRLQTP